MNGRACTHIQVTHTEKRDHFRYHQARIFIDEELKVPVYYASYDWPREEGGQLRLLEEYAYTNIKLNVGLSDADFDPRHPDYNFRLDD